MNLRLPRLFPFALSAVVSLPMQAMADTLALSITVSQAQADPPSQYLSRLPAALPSKG